MTRFNIFQNSTVYVFVGENLALEDFVRVMQNKKLLETGNYMVVSVNDEIYEKMLGGDILYRSRGEFVILQIIIMF